MSALPKPTESERRMDGPALPAPKAKRTHGKRHSVNRERSHDDRAKAARQAAKQAAANATHRQIKDAMRAYYRGEIPDLSSIAPLLAGPR